MTAPSEPLKFTVVQLTASVVERAYADVVIGKLGGKVHPHDVQNDLFDRFVKNALSAVGPEIAGSLHAEGWGPNFSDSASDIWLDKDFMLPAVMGYAEFIARKIGLNSREKTVFSVTFQRGGWLDVRYVTSEIISTEERRKATALVYSQIVAYATRQVLEDSQAVAIGLNSAWRTAA